MNKPTKPMKKYIQLKETWSTKAGDEWVSLQSSTLYAHIGTSTLAKEDVLKSHPEWFKEVTEPKPSFKKWRAEFKGTYYYVNDLGQINISREENRYDDNYRYLTGNYFQTREEAKAYKARQEAIGRVTHAIIEANEGWEPDWVSDNAVYNIIAEHGISLNVTLCTLQFPTLFPPCKTKDLALSIISSHKEDLDLIFNLK